jgi:hypothetical protein
VAGGKLALLLGLLSQIFVKKVQTPLDVNRVLNSLSQSYNLNKSDDKETPSIDEKIT